MNHQISLTLHFGPIWWPTGITIAWLIIVLISFIRPRQNYSWFGPDITFLDIVGVFGGAFFVLASWLTYGISLFFK